MYGGAHTATPDWNILGGVPRHMVSAFTSDDLSRSDSTPRGQRVNLEEGCAKQRPMKTVLGK
jgi:hypothetical protein